MELGNLADVLSAVAAIVGGLVSVAALKTARDANALAEKTRAEAEQREKEAQQKEISRAIQAWWVHQHREGKDTWGVVLQNHNPQSSAFYDVTVSTTGNDRCPDPIHVEVLPPGSYFVQSGEQWGWPEPVSDLTAYEPILKSTRHRVFEVDYRDTLHSHYTWSPTSGLKIDPPSS